jgi:penicillin-binding protein 2
MQSDTLVPLFNRPVMAMYPPGSIFKTVQALIALEQGVVDPNELIYVDNTLIGDHAPPGLYDLHDAIKFSSNNYFFKTFRKIINHDLDPNTYIDSRMGLERWQEMVMGFGLGTPLGIDIPNEKGGQIPGADYYNRVYGENRWKFSTIASLSIGQGEMLLSPLQMANIAAIMANRGYYYTPHIVKSIGDSNQPLEQFQIRNEVGISPEHYDIIINAMEDALKGTAWRAVIPDVTICGKTGTVENPHGEDHSVFMAFAPKENPQIAISVYVENSGWGGRAAATTASLVVEKYLKGEVSRIWLEDYVLKGEFLD